MRTLAALIACAAMAAAGYQLGRATRPTLEGAAVFPHPRSPGRTCVALQFSDGARETYCARLMEV